MTKRARTLMPIAERRAAAMSIIGTHGTTLDQLMPVAGFLVRQNLASFMATMAAEGLVFSCRCVVGTKQIRPVFYFADMESRDAFYNHHHAIAVAAAKERQLEHGRANKRKQRAKNSPLIAKRKAEQAQARAERAAEKAAEKLAKALQPRPPKIVQPPKPKPPRVVKPPKSVSIPKHAGTAIAATPKPSGPARRSGPIDLSQAKIIVAPPPPDRWAVQVPVGGGFSHLKPGQYAFPPASCAARAA